MRLFYLICFCVAVLPSVVFARVLDVQSFQTPKGITVWLVEDHSLPVLSMSFAFRAGAANAPFESQGVTQLLSNTLDEGAGDMNAKAFQGILRDRAIELSFSSTRDEFVGSFRTITRHRDEALALLKLALTKPRFDAEAVARMRAANISRIKQSIGDADWISTRLLYDAVYKGHPYALNAGGTIASMQALTADDLRAEWARIAAVDTLVVSMTGDVKKEDAIKIVDDVFGALPARVGDVVLQKAEMPESGKPLFYAYDMPQSVLSMAWDGVGVNDPDYYAATVMNYIFGGGGFSSRLMDEVREKRGLTYGISSQMLNDVYADRYVVSASMQPQNVKGTIEAVKSIAQGLIDAPINADELQAAKDYLVGSLPVSLSSSMRIANALTVLQLADRSPNFFDAYNAKIQSVTQADIARVAKRVFSKPPIIVMVGAKPAAMDFETIVTLPNTEKPTP